MKLWYKGLSLDKTVEKFTVGNDFELDQLLIKYDVIASIAHCKMLAKLGILTKKETQKLIACLHKITKLVDEKKFEIKPEDEDCHTAIENYLIKHCGETGKKVHTFRSRNDQVLVALRLYMKDQIGVTIELICKLVKCIQEFSKSNKDVGMPGYTHMQKAMPSSVNMWADSFAEELTDLNELLTSINNLIDQNPLGSTAGYGTGKFKLDRKLTTELMGFKRTQVNPIYCGNSRGKFESIVISGLSQVMLTLNKIATDLMLFTTQEFNFFSLQDEFLTGSSIMPQKDNYDLLELLRAKSSLVLGHEFMVKNLISNLPSGYNRDFQLTKEPLILSFETTKGSLIITKLVFQNLQVNKDVLKKAMTPELYATQEAYELVSQGIPFREAYKKISKKYSLGYIVNKHL